MADPRPPGHHDEPFDREIGIRGITRFLVALTVGCVVTAIAVFGLYKFLQSRQVAQDAPPSPLVDRSVPRLPPEPRLQVAPERELAAMRAEQQAVLESFGWVDETAGVARIPIDVAMDWLLVRGLPARAAAGDPVMPAPLAAPAPAASHPLRSAPPPQPVTPPSPGGGH